MPIVQIPLVKLNNKENMRRELLTSKKYQKKIKEILDQYRFKSEALSTILIDQKNFKIFDSDEQNSGTSANFYSLPIAAFVSAQKLASKLGEDNFQELLYQGKQISIRITNIKEKALLLVIFDQQSCLGTIKNMEREVSHQLERIFLRVEKSIDVQAA